MRGRLRVGRAALVALWLLTSAAPAGAFQEAAGEPEAGQTRTDEHAEEESHDAGGLVDVVARVINFGILAGLIIYVARSPVGAYLSDRRDQIRGDLVQAAQMRKTANEQLAEIDRRLAALPGELDALTDRGAQEIAAEEARITKAAETERERLLAQMRRDLDLEVRIARAALRAQAAELATGVARRRIVETITADDQERLMDRYLRQLDEPEART